MLNSTRIESSIGAIAVAAAISMTAGAMPAFAQKVKTPEPAANQAQFTVEVGDVEAVGSSMDVDALQAVLSGDVEGHAEDLATLDAQSITVPEIRLTASGGDKSKQSLEFVYSDIVFEDVSAGVAATVSVGSVSVEGGDEVSGTFDTMTAADLNIGGLLAFYGLVESGNDDFQTIYSSFEMPGGSIQTDEMSCEIHALSIGEFSARPLATPFAEFMQLAAEMEANSAENADGDPDPELLREFLPMYADLISAFRSEPFSFGGIDCSGESEEGDPMTVAIGPISIAGFEPGIYPEIAVDGLSIDVTGGDSEGSVSAASFIFKGFDFSGQLEMMRDLPADISEEWFGANARQFIPEFGGFSVSGVNFDIPDPDAEGERITASIGNFDLTLANYINGIPASIDSSAANVVVELPADSEDEQIQQLQALGLETIDLGFRLSLDWDDANEVIELTSFMLEGANLGAFDLAATIGNATNALFSDDNDAAMVAAMGLTLHDLQLSLTDNGISELVLADAAAEQGVDVATIRPMFAGVAEGMTLGLLNGAENASEISTAIAGFVRNGGSLFLDITATDEAGIGIADYMAAQENPTILIDQVRIEATAE